MKYGILGGTFDPPHLGHLELAQCALKQLDLDEVIFVPTNKNPFKKSSVANATQRLEMVQLLIEGHPRFSVSDIEITRGDSSYTVDTLQELKMVRPGSYWIILGADSLAELEKWKDPEKLLDMARIAAASRDQRVVVQLLDQLPLDFSKKVDLIEMPAMPISSSKIREDLGRRNSTDGRLTPNILEYINRKDLYNQ